MKTNEFMLVFRFEPNFNYQPLEAELDEKQQQWGCFIGNIMIQEKLINTYQLGFEGVVISKNKLLKEGIHIADLQTLAGNMVIKANSIAEATEMAKNCPILQLGGIVEVRNIQIY